MIIGIVGPICSGKDVVAEMLVSKGFTRLSLADELREEGVRRSIEITRTNLQDLGDELRNAEGLACLAKRVRKHIIETEDYVITGFRNPAEVEELMNLEDFHLIMLGAPLEQRFTRARQRARERESVDFDDFKKIDERDLGINQPEHGQQNMACFKLAEKGIMNTGSVEELRGKVDRLLEELRG